MIRRRVLFAALLAALFAVGWWAGGVASRDLYADLDLFVEVLHKVEVNYVDPVAPKPLVQGAIKGMLRQLDPYTQYLDAKDLAGLKATTEGAFGGIGVEVSVREGYPTVIAPIEGTPAWEAGLHSGDVIVEVDGKSTYDLTVQEVADRLRGPAGSQVTVKVSREGDEEPAEYTLTRRVVERPAVPYAFVLDGGLGYLRLTAFSEGTDAEVREAVARLRREGARSLVLDLRLNPGGLLDQAVGVAGEFVPKGTLVVYTRGRAQGDDQRYFATQAAPEVRWPMVVLVDGGSASASEVVAGALQDLDRALVVGSTTFGKGRVQRVFPIRGRDAALKLTTALYYTPSGRSIDNARAPGAGGSDTLADDEDESDDGTPAPSPGPPSAGARDSRPVFHTRAGRVVYGGGGIAPDVGIVPDTLTGLMRRIESRNLAFRFANRWLNQHPQPRPDQAASPPWSEFLDWLRAEKVEFTPAEAAAQRPAIERAVRREMARRMLGDASAARVALEGDPVFARAREVLGRARAPRDVFAAAHAPAGRPAPRTAAR